MKQDVIVNGESIVFIPCKYIKTESDIGHLEILAGEELFINEIHKNKNTLDIESVNSILNQINQPFFLSNNKEYMFSVDYNKIKEKHGPLIKLNILQALLITSIDKLEESVEKISIKLNKISNE